MKNGLLNQMALSGLVIASVICTAGAAKERELIAVVQSNAGAVEKCAACQQLRIYGTPQSVAALAAVLGDERVGHAARYALEGMPYAEAGAALRDALGRTSGAIKAGLIDSLGRRRDVAATPLLTPLLADADATVAVAGASALGWIGDEAAAGALRAACDSRNPKVRRAVLEALLRCAEARLRQGDKATAAALYREVLEADPDAAIRLAAWRGEVLSDDARRAELVLAALTGTAEPLRRMAVRLVQETKDEEILKACLRQWPFLGADAQALVVNALADRGERSALPAVLEACRSSTLSVRRAALEALGTLGDATSVPTLLKAAVEGASGEQGVAAQSLVRLRDERVNGALISLLENAQGRQAVTIVGALASRDAAGAVPVFLKMARSSNRQVRSVAISGLQGGAGAEHVPALVSLFAGADGGEMYQLRQMLVTVARRCKAEKQASEALAAIQGPEVRDEFLLTLGELGDDSGLPVVRRALNSDQDIIRQAAIGALGRWPNAAALPDLLRMAQEGKDTRDRISALRSYVDLVTMTDSLAPEEKVRCYQTAMGLASEPAEKKKVLSALANVRTTEALQLAASCLSQEQVRAEAARAVLAIAQDTYTGAAVPVKAALGQLVAADVSNEVKEQARKILDQIDAAGSYLLDWEVAGPYLEKGKNYAQLFDTPFEPEKPKVKVPWRKMPVFTTGEKLGYLDLLAELDGGEQRVAYLRTQIESEDLRPVTLEIFSDDGVKAWLNNRVVHSNNVARPIMPEPDRVTVTLQKGVNRLMLKVTQNNLPWGAIVRVREAKAAQAKIGEGFKVHVVNANSRFEAAGVLDVNRDGKLDIFCGGLWYEAPEWKQHFVREVKEEGNYYYDFANLPMDVDGDGWVDIANAAWHNKMVFWERNPGKGGGSWEVFEIDTPGNMETALAFDINGDGQLDVLPNIMTAAAWYEYRRDASAPGGAAWQKHDLPKEGSGHGNGAGDVNRDGRCDIVVTKGWLEQTATGWQWHPEFELGHASVPILVHDVDGDGDSDIVWGLGHDYGLFWLEQMAQDGQRAWAQHLIDKSWSQPHFMVLADLDGDRKADLVTGKRHYAHNGNDPGGNDPVCVYYYTFDTAAKSWTRHTIHEGGRVGFGINTAVVDIDGDGDLDVVAPGKSGLYLLENVKK